jgi:hypothetical protein
VILNCAFSYLVVLSCSEFRRFRFHFVPLRAGYPEEFVSFSLAKSHPTGRLAEGRRRHVVARKGAAAE